MEKDKKKMEKLIEPNMRFVVSVANQYKTRDSLWKN